MSVLTEALFAKEFDRVNDRIAELEKENDQLKQFIETTLDTLERTKMFIRGYCSENVYPEVMDRQGEGDVLLGRKARERK